MGMFSSSVDIAVVSGGPRPAEAEQRPARWVQPSQHGQASVQVDTAATGTAGRGSGFRSVARGGPPARSTRTGTANHGQRGGEPSPSLLERDDELSDADERGEDDGDTSSGPHDADSDVREVTGDGGGDGDQHAAEEEAIGLSPSVGREQAESALAGNSATGGPAPEQAAVATGAERPALLDDESSSEASRPERAPAGMRQPDGLGPAAPAGFRALPAKGPLLSPEAARVKCEHLAGLSVPMAARCLAFVRALQAALRLGCAGKPAVEFATKELAAALGRTDVHGVPGSGGLAETSQAAQAAARAMVVAQRQEARRAAAEEEEASLQAEEEEWTLAQRMRDPDSPGVARGRAAARRARMPRSAAQSLQSILLHTPGASVAAGLQAAVGSLASATSAFLRGADRLPTAEGVRRCMEVLFVAEGPPTAAWAPSQPGRAFGPSVCGSAPGDLVSRFVVLAGRMAGVRGIAVLWRAFVSELRERWHRAEPLPHVTVRPSQPVDLGQGLLSQKLMLLAWCTARLVRGEAWEAALAAEAAARGPQDCEVVHQGTGLDHAAGREEPASRSADARESVEPDSDSDSDSDPDPEAIAELRSGHRRRLPGMVLLRSRLAMYEPETQPSSAFTEDTLLEHQALLMKMGSDADATAHRAGLHAAGLRSDMAAFKAANPTCCFADFVRWHSPNDWVALSEAGASMEGSGASAGADGAASDVAQRAEGASPEAGEAAAAAGGTGDSSDAVADEAEERISPRRLDGRLSARFPGCVPAVEGVDDASDGWAHAAPVAGSPPLSAPPTTTGPAGAEGSIWMRAWSESVAAPVSLQKPVVNVEAQAEQALHYLETLTLQELLPMLFAVAASNGVHVLDNAVEGVAERSPECAWRSSLARRALSECCKAAGAIALAESAGEHDDDAARAALMSGYPAGARGKALPGFGSPARHRKAMRTLEQRGRVHDFFGAAYAAVCAVADAETALARFTALCHHLDTPQSRGAMAWRAADAELSVPGSPSAMRHPEAQATSIAAVALLCGGCVAGPLSAENSPEAALIAALADDALRQDAAYLPDALEGGHLSARVRHLVPQAQTEQSAVAYMGADEDEDDWAGDGALDQARAAELALDDEDGSAEAADTSPPRAALPRLGSSLIAGRSESAIQVISKALEGRGLPGLAAAKPSERLCVAVRLAPTEAAIASCAPVAVECEARGLPHVSSLEVLASTSHPKGGPGLVYLCATQSAVRVSASQPDTPS